MNHVVKAKMLRESDEPIHYNCAQSLFVAFSDVLGVSDERAFAMGANYIPEDQIVTRCNEEKTRKLRAVW